MKPPDPVLDALWKNALERWEEDAAHHAFLEHCERNQVLDEAAVRYRGMKGDHERGPGADKRLRAVLMLAMSKLELQRAEPKAASAWVTKLVLVSFFLLGSLVLLLYLLQT